MKSLIRYILIGLLSGMLCACASSNMDYSKLSAQQIYNRGMSLYKDKDYQEAKNIFLEIEQQHPYSSLVADGELMAGVSAYKGKSYIEAEAYISKFIDLYPSHPKVDYAYFIKAQIYYDQVSNPRHDQSFTQKALDAIVDMENRYPHSPYTVLLHQQKSDVIEHLAGHDMAVGRFYEKKKDYVAAIGRFQYVVLKYAKSKQVPEALYRLIECYVSLGLDDVALYTVSALGYSYPDSTWYHTALSLLHQYGISKS